MINFFVFICDNCNLLIQKIRFVRYFALNLLCLFQIVLQLKIHHKKGKNANCQNKG